jgi:hypothetical protein
MNNPMKLPVLKYTFSYTFDPSDYLAFCEECEQEPTPEGWKDYVLEDLMDLLSMTNVYADDLKELKEVEE